MVFEYFKPSTIDELKKIFRKIKNVKAGLPRPYIMAGGTDLLVKLKHKTIEPSCIIDIKNIKNINSITNNKKYISIGAGATLNQIAENPLINTHLPALGISAKNVGSYQIRNRATLAGNICNSSPAADTIPALLIYTAKINIISGNKKRCVSIHKFFTGPGKNILKTNECVESILIPIEKNKSLFCKFSRRRAVDLSTVNIAAGFFGDGKKTEIRAAVGACAAITARAVKAEKHLAKKGLNDAAIKEAAQMLNLKPISDLRGSADFRVKIAKQLFVRAMRELTTEAQRVNHREH